MKLHRNQSGMTLLEIMIVLAILGGLATLVVTNVSDKFKDAKVKQARIKMANMRSAMDMYYTDCGSYPNELVDLVKQPSNCPNWGPSSYVKKEKDLKDPWNNEFIYEVDGNEYEMVSLGADKREGGEGADKDISSADL